MRTFYKILHTTCETRWGVIEKRIYNELVWMKETGHHLILVCPKDTPLFLKAKEYGIKVYGIDFKPFSFFRNYKFLKNFFYNEKPDIVHSHGKYDSRIALYAARKLKLPLRIFSYHGNFRLKRTFWNRMVCNRLCHYIFTASRHTTGYLQKVFKLKDMRVFTMPAGIIAPETLPEKTGAKKTLALELGLDPETRFIGFSGRLSKTKGISTLLAAFQTVSARLPEYHLVMSGEGTGEALNILKTMALGLKIADSIHFIGEKEDPWTFFRALDCHVLPSLSIKDEDLSQKRQSMLCAMLCETPVIGPASGPVADILVHEKTGLVYEEFNSLDLADKIFQTLKEKGASGERLEAARNFVKKHHTMDTLGRDIIRIYSLHQIRRGRPTFQD
ncbi:MAG: glycosyltransferase family 4 protein [Desulfobacula sp.]|nr:glycosyltransferase family 4 protein [Desulfobacula sp.]MDA8135204.1 glycosyltransferase family 4 protein [Desulfobacteraceae bacterium]